MHDLEPPENDALIDEINALRSENQRLRSLLGLDQESRHHVTQPWEPTLFADSDQRNLTGDINGDSPAEAKIALFRSLFAGREDVYALRWESTRTGKKGWSPAVVGGWANAKKPGRAYLLLDEGVVESHLAGENHLGLYPLRRGDECRLLVSMAQTLARRDDLAEFAKAYGLVVVDECHHVPAVTFERVVRDMPVRHWLGLTATPYRRDHLEKLITMYCGAERYRMTPDHDEQLRVERILVSHTTSDEQSGDEELGIQAVFRALVEDEERSRQICGDIAAAIEARRNCLVLTQWTEHLETLSGELRRLGFEAIVMRGGMGKKARAGASAEMGAKASTGGLALLATGSFLGEGFDLPQLDTLFLAFPLAFKGRIVQYVGRVLRPTPGKSRVEVHDYVDINVPVLARMQAKRLPAFVSLGFPLGNKARPRSKMKMEHSPELRP